MSLITKLQINSVLNLSGELRWIPLVTTVRFRYHKDKIERGPLHRLGYKDKIQTHGLLPRSEKFEKIKAYKDHKPSNPWTKENALYGKNDYIDILGDGNLRPTDVCYEVPPWLRGFKGNEFQMLIRRRAAFGDTMKEMRPLKYSDMNRRIKFLHYFLNRKKRDFYWDKP